MLHKLTLSSFNQKRKRPISLVSNIGPILLRIKRTFGNNNDLAVQRFNATHQGNESTAMQQEGKYYYIK